MNKKRLYKEWINDIDVTPTQMDFLLENYGDENSVIAIHNTSMPYSLFFETGLENYTSLGKKTTDLTNTVAYNTNLLALMAYPNGDGKNRGETAIILKIPKEVFEHKQGIFETLPHKKYGIPPQFIKAAFVNGQVINNDKYDLNYKNPEAIVCQDELDINYKNNDVKLFKSIYYHNYYRKSILQRISNFFKISKKQKLLEEPKTSDVNHKEVWRKELQEGVPDLQQQLENAKEIIRDSENENAVIEEKDK